MMVFESYTMAPYPLNTYNFDDSSKTNNFQDVDQVIEDFILDEMTYTGQERCAYITDTDFRIGIFAHTKYTGTAATGNKVFRLQKSVN